MSDSEAFSESVPTSLPDGIGWRDRIAARLVLAHLGRWEKGAIEMQLPDGSSLSLGNSEREAVSVRVRDWSFFRRLLVGNDIGFGEAYMDGDVEVSDLVELCRLFILDQSMVEVRPLWRALDSAKNAGLRWLRRNTLQRSRQNIREHYDLGNELYELFLDETMSYSAAVFESEADDLATAQRNKIDGVCRQLGLRPEHHLLEIGSGWGAMAIHAARDYGCRVTSLTLSEEQLAMATERAAAAGLSDRIDFRLCDYREAEGRYDRMVSIEMIEAVGYEFFGTFFSACDRMLAPGGKLFLQAITFPDRDFDRYRRDFDWIRKYIFPGGLLPSMFEIAKALRESTELRVEWARDIGPDYARTISMWRRRFDSNRGAVQDLGFDDRFLRMWDFYLASCEAAFSTRYLGDHQLLLSRPLEG